MKKCGLFLALSLVLILTACGFGSEPFTPAAWKESPAGERGRFVSDLVSRKVLLGLRRDEVRCLLGDPGYEGKEYWTYVVERRVRGFDSLRVLHVEFAGESVSRAYQRSD
jgi:outer membrane protein assembly factor BamE (lipoprotein component of BamABCDE complex)